MMAARLRGVPVTISRTGYTGDLGYEIWLDSAHALELWDALIEAGAAYGITPAGMLALDLARIEAGLMLIDVDYVSARKALIESQKSSPFELGLGWAVDLKKERFVGRSALAEEARREPQWQFVGLEIDWNSLEGLYADLGLAPQLPGAAWRMSVPAYAGGEQAGYATSGGWSPLLKKYIALAHLQSRWAAAGTQLEIELTVEHRRKRATARVVPRPFFDPSASAMSQRYDAIVIGGGHNGLVCAAISPARASECSVLERRERVGGAAVSEEVFPGFSLLGVLVCSEPAQARDHPRARPAAPRPAYPAARIDADAARERRLSDAVERSRPEPARARASLAARCRGLRGIRAPDAPHGARGEAAARDDAARPGFASSARPAGNDATGRSSARPWQRAVPRALQADDDELRRLPRPMVRVRAVEGDQVRKRDHRHPRRAALARHRVRSAASLHGRAGRRFPRVGVRKGRQRFGERGNRRSGAVLGCGDSHQRAGCTRSGRRAAARTA
jgi:hypothetical protein